MSCSDRIQIRQAIITAAGRATRLLPATKEQPKVMLPLFGVNAKGELSTVPMVQRVYETLFESGVREFVFVVDPDNGMVIQNHFNPGLDLAKWRNGNGHLEDMKAFCGKLRRSSQLWVSQHDAKGFGDAVLRAANPVGSRPFLVNAGDNVVISKTGLIRRLMAAHTRTGAQATIAIKEVPNPGRYGAVSIVDIGRETCAVEKIVEKPEHPESNWVAVGFYAFDPIMMRELGRIKPGKNGEIQLTDAIQKMVEDGRRVQAIKAAPDDHILDISSPESYWEALSFTHDYYLEWRTKQAELPIIRIR